MEGAGERARGREREGEGGRGGEEGSWQGDDNEDDTLIEWRLSGNLLALLTR